MSVSRTTCLLAACLLAGPAADAAQQRRSTDRLDAMDRNRDGVVTRQEWTGTAEAFEDRDWNEDGVLSGTELRPGARRGQSRRSRETARGPAQDGFDDWTQEGFRQLDRNGDGRISASEWTWEREAFARADHNGDGVVTWSEFLNEDTRAQRRRGAAASTDASRNGRAARAYDAGYERGWTEGVQAGREDRERNQGWDLEGQRELETADSGYTSALGARPDYQAGYRDAFRAGYRDGFER